MKKSGILIVILLMFGRMGGFALEESVLIGREDNWSRIDLMSSTNIDFQEGKHGFWDVVLQEGEYQPDEDTDLLLHFNDIPIHDQTGRYHVIDGEDLVTPKMKQYGEGSAVFQRDDPIRLQPEGDALFAPGQNWYDFSIEFWLYPANLEEGEMVFFWQGSDMRNGKLITQQVICTVRERRLQWEFKNFFLPPDRSEYSRSLTGKSQVVPRRWKHHLLRFDSETGMLEYLVDEVPEGITYASASGSEDGTVYLPAIGEFSSEPVLIGENFTGFIDELRISKRYIDDPFTARYKKTGGAMITGLMDLEYQGSRLLSVTPLHTLPGESAINYYYYLTDVSVPLQSANDRQWQILAPGERLSDQNEGRFLQLMAKLYPDGMGRMSPVVSEIVYEYEPDFPPTRPDNVFAEAGDQSVTLSWKAVADVDLAGYLVYFGDTPGTYWGEESDFGPSPIDVGNTTEVTISGLENDRLYFFSVVAYDDAPTPHHSDFSREVSARPSRLR